MSGLKIKINGNEILLTKPSFLIGNGINYYDAHNLSWANLLIELFPEEKRKEIVESDAENQQKINLKGLTYPEIAELAVIYHQNQNPKEKAIYKIRKDICKKVHEFENCLYSKNLNSKQEIVINFAKNNNIPIMTTNYDFSLLKPLKIQKSKNKIDYLGEKVEDPFWTKTYNSKSRPWRFPCTAYFREEPFTGLTKLDVCTKFAIWHLHGMKRYSSSICLNNKDYAGIITKIKKHLKDIDGKWEKDTSWLNIFMNTDLIIFGLSLDSEESDLRWLLVERFLKQNQNIIHKTVYIYTKDEEMPNGKKKFFESIGIDCLKLSYEEIYSLRFLIKE